MYCLIIWQLPHPISAKLKKFYCIHFPDLMLSQLRSPQLIFFQSSPVFNQHPNIIILNDISSTYSTHLKMFLLCSCVPTVWRYHDQHCSGTVQWLCADWTGQAIQFDMFVPRARRSCGYIRVHWCRVSHYFYNNPNIITPCSESLYGLTWHVKNI